MIHDFRLALRALTHSPLITLAALATLAFGIGANTVVFSLVNALLLKPLPFGEATGRIVSLHSVHPTQLPQSWDDAGISYADLLDVRRESREIEGLGGYFNLGVTLYDEDAVRVDASSVTPNLFELLDVKPVLGRGFLESEGAEPGFESVVLLSYGLWQTRFGGDPDIVGKPIRMNERELEVVGVMPKGFRFPERSDLWIPYRPHEDTNRAARFLHAVGRVRRGASLPAVRAEASAIAARLATRYPDTNRSWGIHVLPYRDLIVDPNGRLLSESLLGAVGLVLLIGCANLASLLLARGTERQRELSVRAALGAGRGPLVRQLLTESLLLGLGGGALGTLLALWGIDAVVDAFPDGLPYWLNPSLDIRVFAFIVALSVLTSLAFGLLPAIRATRFDLVSALSNGRDASASRSQARVQGFLVAGQVAASLALLVGAGLLHESFDALIHADAGFDDRNILTFRLQLSGDAYDPVTAKTAFFQEAARRIESVPGVARAAATLSIPADDGGDSERIVTREHPLADGTETGVSIVCVTPRFFETLGLELLEGRGFDDHDVAEGAPPVAIVNQTLAERLWGENGRVEGRDIGLVSGERIEWLPIVGVAPNVQYEEFGEETTQSQLNVYVPYPLLPARAMAFLVRAEDDPAAVATPIRETLKTFAPGVPTYLYRTMAEVRTTTTWEQGFFSRIFVGFAIAALMLACLGTYGLVAYRAGRRVREIGVRVALGATEKAILQQIVGEGIVLAGIGLASGLVLALGVSRFIERLLYGVPAVNPLLYAGAATLLTLCVLAASYFPARRAARIEPSRALRQD